VLVTFFHCLVWMDCGVLLPVLYCRPEKGDFLKCGIFFFSFMMEIWNENKRKMNFHVNELKMFCHFLCDCMCGRC